MKFHGYTIYRIYRTYIHACCVLCSMYLCWGRGIGLILFVTTLADESPPKMANLQRFGVAKKFQNEPR